MSRESRMLVGAAGLVCVACCVGPILAVLGTIGVASVAGIAVFDVTGAAVGLLAIPAHLRRRRRLAACRYTPQRVPVA